jgi:glycosyltransferase involved in cell wall biosynthesis
MPQTRIAIVHPRLGFGGSESVALWTIEALKDRADVSLITGGRVDLARLNEYYGTSIEAGEIRIHRAPMPWGLRDSAKFSGLRGQYVHRYCRQIAPRFDLLINTYGPCDFGVPAIQCIADFGFVPEWRNTLHPILANHRRWWYGDSPLRRTYLKLCHAIFRPDPEAWKHNLTLANSHWTARLLKEKFSVESQVLYPPVTGNFPVVPWAQRENGFVCVGRVVPEKRMDAVVGILSRVRQHGHDVHLHILGGVDDSPFGRKTKQLGNQHRDWVFLEGWVSGHKKEAMIATHRFGINGRENEPFGIAPAEMVKAGCITFVPNGGGQTEIANHPALTFRDDEDAARKIEAVLASPVMQKSLVEHLSQGAQRFSAENFRTGIRKVVREVLIEKGIG